MNDLRDDVTRRLRDRRRQLHSPAPHGRALHSGEGAGQDQMWGTLLPRVEFLQAYSRLFASPLPKGHVEERHMELALAFGARDRAIVAAALTKHIKLRPQLLRRSGRYGPFRSKEPS